MNISQGLVFKINSTMFLNLKILCLHFLKMEYISPCSDLTFSFRFSVSGMFIGCRHGGDKYQSVSLFHFSVMSESL